VLDGGKLNSAPEELPAGDRTSMERLAADLPAGGLAGDRGVQQTAAGAALPAARWRLLLRAAPALVFVLALAVRLVFIWYYHSPQDFVFSDMWVYDHRAHNLLSGELSAWDTFTPVGYPAALALVYKLGGSPLTVGVLQAVLGAFTALLTMRLARRVFEREALAIAVGLVCALHVPAIFYAGFLLTETLFAFLVVAGTWALVESIHHKSRLGFLACGLVLGLGAAVRPNLLIFLPCVPVIIWLGFRRWRETGVSFLLLAAAFFLPVGVAAAHNARLVGTPTLGTNGGLNFYLNFASVRGVRFRDSRGEHGITPIPNLFHYPKDEWVKVPFYADRHYFGRGLALLKEDPRRLRVAGRNLVESSGVGKQGYWPGDAREGWQRLHRRVFFFAAILPSLLGLGLLVRRRRYAESKNLPLVIAAVLLASSLVTLLLFLGDPRMRVPFDPLLILLAGAAYVWLAAGLRRVVLARRLRTRSAA
jgi:4-amino-4-deoxy-L-arabinose transferase-like glycosyltransferase